MEIKNVLIFVLLANVCFGTMGDQELTGDLYLLGDERKVIWYNGSNYWSVRASGSLAADIDWVWPANAGTGGQALLTDGTNVLSWGTPSTSAAHDLLSPTHSDTTTQTPTRGSLIYGNSTPAWDELVLGASGTILRSDGTDAGWSATTNITALGTIATGVWNATAIDISSYTNLVAGTNITLSGDTLNVDDAFLVNDANDTTTGILTAGGFITTGTGIIGEGLTVNNNATTQRQLTLKGKGTTPSAGQRGGSIELWRDGVGGTKAYIYVNEDGSVVFDTSAQATSGDVGTIKFHPSSGYASFAAGNFVIQSDGDFAGVIGTITEVKIGGSAGVSATATNSVLTLAGIGTGYDESLTLDFGTTENTVVFGTGTGVTTLGFGSLNIGTTGTLAAHDTTITGDGTNAALIINQGNDEKGIEINGFDDQSGSNLLLQIRSDGIAELNFSDTLYFKIGAALSYFVDADGFGMAGGQAIMLDTGTNRSVITSDTEQTNQTLVIGLSSHPSGEKSRTLLICDYWDWAAEYDFAHAAQPDPTLIIHSANASATEWISFTHNQTDGLITTGAGDIQLLPATGFVGIGCAPTVALDVTGDADFEDTIDVNDVTVNGSATSSATLTFGGGGSGDCNSITITSGLITGYTTIP